MKKVILFLFVGLFIFGLQCKNAAAPKETSRPVIEKTVESGLEFSSKYVCPMHCKGSGSDQPGKCPVCEMDYELNESMKTDSAK
ncbi:MAG: heavy metal-binding domain-containing protein [Saprospiraceae bacterium]